MPRRVSSKVALPQQINRQSSLERKLALEVSGCRLGRASIEHRLGRTLTREEGRGIIIVVVCKCFEP